MLIDITEIFFLSLTRTQLLGLSLGEGQDESTRWRNKAMGSEVSNGATVDHH